MYKRQDVFQAAGVAQKYNCSLIRLDYQQEQGLVSSLPLGINQIKIQRSLTTSNVAVFVPFVTQELFQSGADVYKRQGKSCARKISAICYGARSAQERAILRCV